MGNFYLIDEWLAPRATTKLKGIHDQYYPMAKSFYQKMGIDLNVVKYIVMVGNKLAARAGNDHILVYSGYVNKFDAYHIVAMHEYSHLAHKDDFYNVHSLTEVPYRTDGKKVKTTEFRCDLEPALILNSVDESINAMISFAHSLKHLKKPESNISNKRALELADILNEKYSSKTTEKVVNYPSLGDRIRNLVALKHDNSRCDKLNDIENSWREQLTKEYSAKKGELIF